MVVVVQSVALVAAVSHYRGDEVTCDGAVVVPPAAVVVAAVCECFDLFECHICDSCVLVSFLWNEVYRLTGANASVISHR